MSERMITKVDGLPKDVKPLQVAKACVIGAGTMGGGITMCFANAGIDVTMVDQSAEAVERGMGIITGNYAATAKKGRLSEAQMAARLGKTQSNISTPNEIAFIKSVGLPTPIKYLG